MRSLLVLALVLLVPGVAAFDSGNMEPGATWTMTFTEENPSGYHYHCHPHPSMTGMVHVMADTDGQTKTHNVEIYERGATEADWGYDVQHLEIEVGDTVVWRNEGTMVHTVTEMSGDGHDHDHGDHDHTTDDKDSPLPLAVVGVGLLFAALRRRA